MRRAVVDFDLINAQVVALRRFENRGRQQHGNTFSIRRVSRQFVNQIAFLQLNGNQDVAGASKRKQQVCDGHGGRKPENHQPSNVQRMSDVSVETRFIELKRRVGLAFEVQPRLTNSEQLKVIQQTGRVENCRPTEPIKREKSNRAFDAGYAPYHSADRLPKREQ